MSDLFLSGWKHQFPTTVYENSCSYTSLPTFTVVNLLNFGNCTKCIGISYCNLNLHFPDHSWCWTLECTYWSFACLLWDICSNILPIFKFSCLSSCYWGLRILICWTTGLCQTNVWSFSKSIAWSFILTIVNFYFYFTLQ